MLFAGHQIMVQFRYKMHELHWTNNNIFYTLIVSTNRYLDHLRLLEEKMWGEIDRGVHLQLIKEQAQIAIRKVFILRVTVGFERLWQQSIWILLLLVKSETVTALHDADDTEPCHVLRAQRSFYSDSSPIIVLPLLLNDWLTNFYLVNLIDVALASEGANSKLVVYELCKI